MTRGDYVTRKLPTDGFEFDANTELPMPGPFSRGERMGGNQIIFPTIESKAPKGQRRQSDNCNPSVMGLGEGLRSGFSCVKYGA